MISHFLISYEVRKGVLDLQKFSSNYTFMKCSLSADVLHFKRWYKRKKKTERELSKAKVTTSQSLVKAELQLVAWNADLLIERPLSEGPFGLGLLFMKGFKCGGLI